MSTSRDSHERHPDLEVVRERIVDSTARAISQKVVDSHPVLQEALFHFSAIGAALLNSPADSHNSLFMVLPYGVGGMHEAPTLPRRARPPTHLVARVAHDGCEDQLPTIHRTDFPAIVHAAAFGPIPHQPAGTPADLYDIPGGPPEAVFVPKVSDWHPQLQNYRIGEGKERDELVTAILRDCQEGTVNSLLALPLLCPWPTVSSTGSRKLVGHVLITSSAPSLLRRSQHHRTVSRRSELESVLSAFAELVAVASNLISPASQ